MHNQFETSSQGVNRCAELFNDHRSSKDTVEDDDEAADCVISRDGAAVETALKEAMTGKSTNDKTNGGSKSIDKTSPPPRLQAKTQNA